LIGHVRAKYEELKLYRPNTTDLKVLQERDEMDRIYTFLAALEPSYEPIRAQILLSTEKLSFEAVTTQVRQEALWRVAMGAPDSNPKPESHAFSAHRFNLGKGRNQGSRERCSHCNRDGHSQERCWILHPHLRPRKNQGETANKKAVSKILEPEKREFLSTREDASEKESKGGSEGTNSRNESNRLDRLEAMLAKLIYLNPSAQ
jgi:hypothetical protein